MSKLVMAFWIPVSFTISALVNMGTVSPARGPLVWGWDMPALFFVLLFPTAAMAYWAGISRDK